jgi:hypothetical protein
MQNVIEGKRQPFLTQASETFRTATIYDLERFRDVATAVSNGSIGGAEAEARAEEIESGFARIMELALKWGVPGLTVVLMVVQIVLQLRSMRSDDISHDDVMKLLGRQTEIQEQLLDEMRLRDIPSSPTVIVPSPPSSMTATSLGSPHSTAHERLRALWAKGKSDI